VFRCRKEFVSLLAALVVAGCGNPLYAQALRGPDRAPIQRGPLALAPTFEVTNLGFDGNVFSRSELEGPKSDFGLTASPALDAWLRMPVFNVAGRTEFDFIYYNELSHIRAVDTSNSIGVEVFLGRLRPYAFGSLAHIKHRRTIEIDAPVRRVHDGVGAGVDVWLSGKTTIGIRASRAGVAYEEGAEHFENNLARALNRTSTGEQLRLRYAATPLTSIALEVNRERDRFEFSPERDTNRLRLAPVIEFKPLALMGGSVAAGIQRSTTADGVGQKAGGSFLHADVHYTLRGRTRFAVQAERDIAYSYRVQETEYRQSGFSATVTHRLAYPWDVRGSVGRYRLTYLTASDSEVGPTVDPSPPTESLIRYGLGCGYLIGRARFGVNVRYSQRDSTLSPRREYGRLQLYSSLTYAVR
jgi:hypothetical protein